MAATRALSVILAAAAAAAAAETCPNLWTAANVAWCGTCTQSGVNCFTGSNSCQGPYDAQFCRLNMAGEVCARN